MAGQDWISSTSSCHGLERMDGKEAEVRGGGGAADGCSDRETSRVGLRNKENLIGGGVWRSSDAVFHIVHPGKESQPETPAGALGVASC